MGVPEADADGDGLSVCQGDNCPLAANPFQGDMDVDGQGDACDPDDGLLLLQVLAGGDVSWPAEPVYTSYNAYRGDLRLLRAGGGYTQEPVEGWMAARSCGSTGSAWSDSPVLSAGDIIHYLVTGMEGTSESSIGGDSANGLRPNDAPCP